MPTDLRWNARRCCTPGVTLGAMMAQNGLRQGEDGLDVYAMCEVPSNAVQAEAFLQVFDGFSIGSTRFH